jgi:hypothetical protein
MYCVICKTKFYYATYLDPPDTCDCGFEITKEDAEDDPDRAAEALGAWKRQCEEDGTGEEV